MTMLVKPDDGADDERSPLEGFQLLDIHTGGYVVLADRIDAIATISSGHRDPQTELPVASRDGTIHLSDPDHRAPALRTALDAADQARRDDKGNIRTDADGHHEPMKLTIAFPFDDPNLFIQQRYTLYTATALKVYGDAHELHEIVTRESQRSTSGRPTLSLVEHLVHPARLPDGKPNPKFRALVKQCKCSWSVYFALARWDGLQAVVPFDDGFPNLYRLRTTSPRSMENIVGTLRRAARTQALSGHIAGLPFELRITYPEQADPTGTKRHAPVWVITAKPPQGIMLRGSNLLEIFGPAIAEGRALQPSLPSPSSESWDTALGESVKGVDVIVDDEDAVDVMMTGDPPADPQRWGFRWVSRVANTVLDSDVARAKFISEYTNGRTDLVSVFLRTSRASECERLMVAVDRYLSMLELDASKAGVDPATGEVISPVVDVTPSVAEPDPEAQLDDGDMGEGGWPDDTHKMSVEPPTLADAVAATNAWLFDLSRRYREHRGFGTTASKSEHRLLGKVLMDAGGGNKELAIKLLQKLTGRTELSATTEAHYAVLVPDAAVDGWMTRIDALKRAIGEQPV